MSKEITIEDIEKYLKELKDSGIGSRRTTFNLPQGDIGGGWYRVSDGCLTNKAGWEAFQKELIKQGMASLKK